MKYDRGGLELGNEVELGNIFKDAWKGIRKTAKKTLGKIVPGSDKLLSAAEGVGKKITRAAFKKAFNKSKKRKAALVKKQKQLDILRAANIRKNIQKGVHFKTRLF